MNTTRRHVLGSMFGLSAAAALPAAFAAGEWPQRAVRMIVPFAPAGATDIVGRLAGRQLEARIGQAVVVENKGGGGGIIGSAAAAQAPADGYTLLMGTAETFGIAQNITPANVPYQRSDFVPVALITRIPSVFCVHPSVPAKTMQEFIAWAKANPGKVNFASPGKGTNIHLIGEMLKARFKLDMVHVPYKGGSPAVMDLVAGQVQMMPSAVAAIAPRIKEGQVRALAVTSQQRSPLLPDVPTMAEAGVDDFVVGGWFGLLVRTGTPSGVIERLEREFQAIGADPAFRKALVDVGGEGDIVTGAAFGKFIDAETARWRQIVQAAHIQGD